MTLDTSDLQRQEEIQQQLSEADQRILEQAGSKVLQRILEDFQDKGGLSSAILLPDVSARPLAYLLLPTLRSVAQKLNKPIPRIFFNKNYEWGKAFPTMHLK